MKRSPLLRRSPMRARRPMRRGATRSAYASRTRDFAHMMRVKALPCAARELGPCEGVIEADHTGSRGLGRKASDLSVIPICTGHHRARTDFSGVFRSWNQAQMRVWLAAALVDTLEKLPPNTISADRRELAAL